MMSQLQIKVALACCLSLSLGCSGRKAVWSKGADAPSSSTTTPAATGPTAAEQGVTEGDAAWQQRTSADNVRKALAAWEKAAGPDSKDLDLLVKLTRGHYFLADGYLRDDEDAYLAAMDKAVSWGERAITAASPEFDRRMRGGAKLHEAVKIVPKEGVPAMYWYASALGKWAKKKGFAVLLGQKDNVKATMDRVLELDPGYYHAGPHRYFGAYYAIAPSFAGGDLEKSKVHFSKSLELAPGYVGTKVLWAQELAVKQQDEETFERLLNEVISTPENVLPDVQPEAMVEKQKARELLAQKDELF